MQTTLGRTGDYAVRAVLNITRSEGDRRKTREIAAAMDIPARFLTQILASLVAEGILHATAGPTGGYVLAKPAEEITLLEVVEAAEGPIALDKCVLSGGRCEWGEVCPVHIPWSRAQNAFREELAKASFADLRVSCEEISAGEYVLPPDAPLHELSTDRRCPDPHEEGIAQER
ncbi:MAG: Rrf2 family transcriptional regulator [Actinomycetota bacterium]